MESNTMPGNKPPLHRSRAFQIALGAAISLLCLGWAFWSMMRKEDPQSVLRKIGLAFARADYRTLPLILVALFAFYWLKACRWRILLAPHGRFGVLRQLFPSILIGFAFNNLLPMRLGEFIRCFVFARRQKQPFVTVLASVALERILDSVTLLAYLGLGLMFVPRVDHLLRKSAFGAAIVTVGLVCGAVVYLFWTAAFVRFAEGCLRRIRFVPEAARHRFAAILESGAAGLMAIKSVRDMAGVLAISVVHWALNGLVIYLSLQAFSIDVSWAACLVLMGGVAIMVAFPSAPGFFGVIQLGFMLVLGAFVQDQESVFAASIYYHMCGYIPVTLSGVTYFILTGMKLSEVRQVAEQKRDEPVEDMGAQPAGGAVAAVPSGIGAGTENE